jgi:hypothetical protein
MVMVYSFCRIFTSLTLERQSFGVFRRRAAEDVTAAEGMSSRRKQFYYKLSRKISVTITGLFKPLYGREFFMTGHSPLPEEKKTYHPKPHLPSH